MMGGRCRLAAIISGTLKSRSGCCGFLRLLTLADPTSVCLLAGWTVLPGSVRLIQYHRSAPLPPPLSPPRPSSEEDNASVRPHRVDTGRQ